jgi:hypothetical protein
MVGIDPRSLAVFRMAMGALLLGDLAIRAMDLKAMYTDEGMFPRSEICYHYTTIWNWSFNFGSGIASYQAMLFAVAAVLGLALLIGLETHLATIGSWLMLVSLHHRVPPILSGADVLLRMLLFWAMFLPLGRVWSLDTWRERWRSGALAEIRAPVLSFGSAAILLQIGLMYLFSAIFKSNLSWLHGDVISRSLRHDFFASQMGPYLLHFPWLLSGLTWGTFILEWAALPLLFFPNRTPSLRLCALAALALMHLGIFLSMKVDLFSPTALAGLTLFLPAEFWDSRLLARFSSQPEAAKQSSEGAKIQAQGLGFYFKESICLLLLMNVVLININSLPSHPLTVSPPLKTSFLKTACGFGQKWSMFDNVPSKSGWYVAWAKLRDGSDVDLLRKGSTLDWTKPYFPASMYPNYRWRKCFREMAYTDEQGYQVFRAPVAEFLCRDWNRRNRPEKQVAEFDLIYCNEASDENRSLGQSPVRERLVHLDFNSEDGRIVVSGV